MRRWPIIRHIRWYYLAYGHAKNWIDFGRHQYLFQNQDDWKFLERVWRGEE